MNVPGQYFCKYCDKVCKTKSGLTNHTKNHIIKSLQEQKIEKKEKNTVINHYHNCTFVTIQFQKDMENAFDSFIEFSKQFIDFYSGDKQHLQQSLISFAESHPNQHVSAVAKVLSNNQSISQISEITESDPSYPALENKLSDLKKNTTNILNHYVDQ